MITSLDARWPGSMLDTQIFEKSLLRQRFQEGMIKWELWTTLEWTVTLWHFSLFCSLTGLFDGLLVGDRTYACQSFLMTPHPDPETKPQHDFNMALSQTRLKIDMTLAILKARFNCLCDLRVSPERASQIIGACVILHNIGTIRKEQMPNEYQLPPDDIEAFTEDHPSGRGVRDAITAEYFT